MIIGIWGRDGIGKSTLADALGVLFARNGITVVIDTDQTQPTLPARISGATFDGDTSLGRVLNGIGETDVSPFLHQHPKHKNLFYAGLTDREDCLSCEIGLEADNLALDFMQCCRSVVDTVILDISGQRTDPFVPAALTGADTLIVPFTPDVQGACWMKAVRTLIDGMGKWSRILPVAAMADVHHDLMEIEKAAGVRFAAALPFARELRLMRDTDVSALGGTTHAAFRYLDEVRSLYAQLKMLGGGKA